MTTFKTIKHTQQLEITVDPHLPSVTSNQQFSQKLNALSQSELRNRNALSELWWLPKPDTLSRKPNTPSQQPGTVLVKQNLPTNAGSPTATAFPAMT